MTVGRSRRRTLLLGVLTTGISIALAVVASEIVLRVLFRDGGRSTLGGPGGHAFEYTYAGDGERRGPLDTGPKSAGVSRVMVMGDSITWGQGVRRWEDTYPAKALQALNAEGRRYDMAVYAVPGKEIDGHLTTIEQVIPEVDPDLVVYQWYNNDVEVAKTGRPRSQRAWREWPWHEALRRWSYLYFVVDFALDARLPAGGRSYVQYLEEDYAEGTPGWTSFARTFHQWAAHATGYASRTILLLYPPVPMTALVDLRQRVTALAAGQTLSFAPGELGHDVGTLADGTWGPVRHALVAPAGSPPGVVAATPAGALAHGRYEAAIDLRVDQPSPAVAARVRVVAGPDAAVLASRDVTDGGLPGSWQTVAVPFEVRDRVAVSVRILVDFVGPAPVIVDTIALPVSYGIEVVDLQPALAGINTAASAFDAHPNAAAHAVMADALVKQIRSGHSR